MSITEQIKDFFSSSKENDPYGDIENYYIRMVNRTLNKTTKTLGTLTLGAGIPITFVSLVSAMIAPYALIVTVIPTAIAIGWTLLSTLPAIVLGALMLSVWDEHFRYKGEQ